ncbi:hypothetical protein KKF91_19545, partial [Myxococcota bacterium]|nr:hypothetical protein [Myxococcota bacterium]
HPGVEGVVLPEHLRAQPVVRLHLSRTFNLSVLEIGPLAVRADLSFQGQRSLCVLPWAAIVGLISEVSEAQYLFPLHDEPDQATAPPVTPSPQPQRRPHLKVIT